MPDQGFKPNENWDPKAKARDSLIMSVLKGSWQAPQNLIGLGTGIYKTGKMPRVETDPEGNLEYRFDVEGQDPQTVGQIIMGPSNMTPESLAHERVHTEQSRKLGPLYTPARLLGELMSRAQGVGPYLAHPMEHEAYLRTASTENLGNYLNQLEAERARTDPALRAKMVTEALEKQRAERAKMGLD